MSHAKLQPLTANRRSPVRRRASGLPPLPPGPLRSLRATRHSTIGGPAVDDAWRQTVEARLIVTETRQAVDEVHRLNVEKRLGSIEDTLKWLVRLILGAILLSILALTLNEGITLG